MGALITEVASGYHLTLSERGVAIVSFLLLCFIIGFCHGFFRRIISNHKEKKDVY